MRDYWRDRLVPFLALVCLVAAAVLIAVGYVPMRAWGHNVGHAAIVASLISAGCGLEIGRLLTVWLGG